MGAEDSPGVQNRDYKEEFLQQAQIFTRGDAVTRVLALHKIDAILDAAAEETHQIDAGQPKAA